MRRKAGKFWGHPDNWSDEEWAEYNRKRGAVHPLYIGLLGMAIGAAVAFYAFAIMNHQGIYLP